MPEPFANDTGHRTIIEIDSGRHVVLGGAGTAKTSLLVERTRRAACRISTGRMANITHSRRAAMKIRKEVTESAHEYITYGVYTGSLHGLCLQMLKEEGLLGNEFSVIGEDEALDILQMLGAGALRPEPSVDLCKKAINCQHWVHMWKSKYDNAFMSGIQGYDRHACMSVCEAAEIMDSPDDRPNKATFCTLYDNIEDIVTQKTFGSEDADTAAMVLLARRYEVYKKENNLIDFQDMLTLAYDYLQDPDCHYLKYSWIQVDEAQDLSDLEMAIVESFASKNACIVYFADNQQSVLSFRGVKMETLTRLINTCGGNVHVLHRNYRSRKAIYQRILCFLRRMLRVETALLPHFAGDTAAEPDDFEIASVYSAKEECDLVVSRALRLPLDESMAVIVPSRNDAEAVTQALESSGIAAFKMAGDDVFRSPAMRLISSHLSVLIRDNDQESWVRVLGGLSLPGLDTTAKVRILLKELKDHMLSPSDLLLHPDGSYMAKAAEAWKGEVVVFDTETTGLSTATDDIVQIAAIKLVDGRVVDTFETLMYTSKDIPYRLHGNLNPMFDYYQANPKVGRREGLEAFLNFVGDAVLFAHNAEFDYHILEANLRRDCLLDDFARRHPLYFDSLKMARLAEPRLHSYRLEFLIRALGLEGENTHLAGDDVAATVNLIDHCMRRYAAVSQRQAEVLHEIKDMAETFRSRYQGIYVDSKNALNAHQGEGPTLLAQELRRIYDAFLAGDIISPVPKMDYVVAHVDGMVVDRESEATLASQVNAHLFEICGSKESDLCSLSIVKEHVFIATPYTAKGQEYDRVIVFHANDGSYPHFRNRTQPKKEQKLNEEDARKFYVAMSRARKKLLITYRRRNAGVRNGYAFDQPADPSPFLALLEENK